MDISWGSMPTPVKIVTSDRRTSCFYDLVNLHTLHNKKNIVTKGHRERNVSEFFYMVSGSHDAYFMLHNHCTPCTCLQALVKKKKNGKLVRWQTAARLSGEEIIGPSRAAGRLGGPPGLIICRQPVFSPFSYGVP